MLVIRFLRIGKKNQPSFKIVVTNKKRSSVGGRFIEEVGFYNPLTKEKFLRRERFQYWLSKGAQPSPTVHNLLVEEKVIQDKKILVHKISKKVEEQEVAKKEKEAVKEKIATVEKEEPKKEKKEEKSKEEAKEEAKKKK